MADVSRRTVLLGAAAMTAATLPGTGEAAERLAWEFSFPSIDGGTLKLADYRGKALLVVNTASFCGFTYQYEGLEKLYVARKDQGLVVIGVPSRDFDQESATNAEVKKFCDATFGIEFPLTGIQKVRGADAHPFYRWVREVRNWEPNWNFGKVLIGRSGRVAGAFGSSDEPMGFRVSRAIDMALAAQV
jgi:glutathione peroxidase